MSLCSTLESVAHKAFVAVAAPLPATATDLMIAAREEREMAETLAALRRQRQQQERSLTSNISRSLWGRPAEDEAALAAAAAAAVVALRPPEQRENLPPPAPDAIGLKRRVLLPYQVTEGSGIAGRRCKCWGKREKWRQDKRSSKDFS